MGNATGLRDQRIKIYELRENGADGFSRPIYYYLYTLWGRLDIAQDQQVVSQSPMQNSEYREQIKATFSFLADIPRNGVLKAGDDIFFIRGVVPRRALWRKDVNCERVDVETFSETMIFEPNEVTDGIHLIYPSAVPS